MLNCAINIKTFRESFLVSGRLDAEYYLPQYEHYLEVLSNYVGNSGDITGYSYEAGVELPTRARRIVATGDYHRV